MNSNCPDQKDCEARIYERENRSEEQLDEFRARSLQWVCALHLTMNLIGGLKSGEFVLMKRCEDHPESLRAQKIQALDSAMLAILQLDEDLHARREDHQCPFCGGDCVCDDASNCQCSCVEDESETKH